MEFENGKEKDLITSEMEPADSAELESGELKESEPGIDELALVEGEDQDQSMGEPMSGEADSSLPEEIAEDETPVTSVDELDSKEGETVDESVAEEPATDEDQAVMEEAASIEVQEDFETEDIQADEEEATMESSAGTPGAEDSDGEAQVEEIEADAAESSLEEVPEETEVDPIEADEEPMSEFRQREMMEPDPEAVLSAVEGLVEKVSEEDVEPEPEPEPVDEQEAVPQDDRLWYVVHCYSGYENKVRHNLEQRIDTMGMKDKIFDVVVPTEEEIEVKDGKRKTVERRVFPGYILVQMILSEESWYVVRNTPGVTGFVGMGNDPTPLRPEEVTSIIKRMEAEAPRIKVTYKIGQKVRIIDGPFNDFIGTVDDIDMERAKVRVMVSFFGRETPVELDFLQVEKA